MISGSLRNFKIFAFTHKTLPLALVGKFHVAPDSLPEHLKSLKVKLKLKELMYISTCNRVEVITVKNSDTLMAADLISAMDVELTAEEADLAEANCEVFRAEDAVKHLFKVSSSLDSMVIGEREIITQVRKAYEDCHEIGITGELIRIVIRKTIETAKQVFTETAIFKKPVSVVSLGFRKLRDMNMPANSRILMIGAGKTNRAMAKFLAKHGYENITIFNRSFARAEELAADVKAKALPLSKLPEYNKGFDVMITCTSASESIITPAIYDSLRKDKSKRKVIIDLAIPADVSPEVYHTQGERLTYVNIEELKQIADRNLAERSKEIEKCEAIIDAKLMEFHDLYKEREIELAMREIPRKVKEIKDMALGTIYAKELAAMNSESREVLDKVIAYMEKKYISVPMKMAKEVMKKS